MLGAVCVVITVMGYIFTDISMAVICIADATAKLFCGAYLLFAAKPSKFVPKK